MPNPTNSDIMRSLGRIDEKIDYVTALAEKTNGRVTNLESWRTSVRAVEKYKEKNPTVVKADTAVFNPIFSSERVKTIFISVVAAVGLLVIAAADFIRARLGG